MKEISRIIQTGNESCGQVYVYCDTYVLSDNTDSVKYLSFFGATAAVKSVTAQIIGNREGVLLENESGFIKQDSTGNFLRLKRGYTAQVKTLTKNLKPGITHKIIYAHALFSPWKFEDTSRFIAFGKTEEEAVNRTFFIVDKLTSIPLKESWKYWLWQKLTQDTETEEVPVKTGGDSDRFSFCRILNVPDDDWLENEIRTDLEYLKAA
ncbi:Uncharacterized protein dnl_06570 [Desulfonema limicola]|uniref:Uncharacterized protein n=1 Tax=Desulfonema limicola TaxID=45656 RepID=A0A975GES3_9BACT|nr:hypothetical protein [Desulfonema limicola]QTA78435.1 Uncharacterized protein dnl_06570 [Desulfonema limicola]